MPVYITNRTFSDEYTGTSTGRFLNGVIGDRITAEISFYIKWSTEDCLLTFNDIEGTITRSDYGGSFINDGWRVGDTFDVTGTSSLDGSYIGGILEVTDTVIRVSNNPLELPGSEVAESASLWGTTLITAIDYYYNLCENETEDFFNLSDRETKPRFSAYDLYASGGGSDTMEVSTNSKAWVNGSATIYEGTITDDYRQEFTIEHTFDITPQWIAAQQENFENGIPPAPQYYADRLALKHIFKIDAKFVGDDPDIPHTGGITNIKGNTSWFDEMNNGSDSPYTVSSITYTDVTASGSVDSIQRCGETDVTMVITSTVALFNNNTEFLLGHFFCPKSETVYINQRTNEYNDCFRYDRALLTGTSTGVDGDEMGTDNQMLTDINVSIDSTTQVTITFRASPSTAIQTQMAAQDEYDMQYTLFLTVQYVAIS
jgi:hypothetical protein